MTRRRTTAWLLTLAILSLPLEAAAFCGFYASSTDTIAGNDTTHVVLARNGTHTSVTMQNDYEGPVEDFALVVPVPQVLKKTDVRTLENGALATLESFTAPRLVEYWERDPCWKPRPQAVKLSKTISGKKGLDSVLERVDERPRSKVRVKNQFVKGEYEIVLLEADESTALESWLTQNGYTLPKGAAKELEPYVQQGMYFFVAKVDPSKVTFANNRALLSPLQFSYSSKNFSLPIRLGLINAKGPQDLLIHILSAEGTRFEVANRPNVTIPTNLEVERKTTKEFGSFYEQLFADTVRRHPRSAITEYAWPTATKCDPCPPRGYLPNPYLSSLGAPSQQRNLMLTRLRTRYAPGDAKDDLVFTQVGPITGGLGTPQGTKSLDIQAAPASGVNRFQGRYIVKHAWTEEITCSKPVRNVWTGRRRRHSPVITAARDTDAPEIKLSSFLSRSSRKLLRKHSSAIEAGKLPEPPPEPPKRPKRPIEVIELNVRTHTPTLPSEPRYDSCAAAHPTDPSPAPAWALAALALLGLTPRRKR